jgi:hypothetical protein
MKRLIFAVVAGLLVWACPNPETGKIDPYLTARTIINQAQTALALADGIFNQWMWAQADPEKVKKYSAAYQKIKTSVANGLLLAFNGVDIAEQAKTDPNVEDLLVEANKAWTNLRKFLSDLLAKPEDAQTVEDVVASAAPSTQPTTAPGVGVKKSALTQKVSPLLNLPKKLGP